ncbi:MAG TPA: hypothetical protein VE821_16480, partial [Pyrinomonadaceae bacterium]|nr:hypothetical protein [Pyrinomonadaceae bacterium]
MKSHASLRRVSALLLICALAAPCFAQTTRPASTTTKPPVAPVAQTTERPSVTIDTLLAADTYAIYGEVRGLGQYVNSKEVQELLAPLRLPGGAPQEMLDLINFVSTHGAALATARVMFAATPVRAKLPEVLIAAELSSPEQAQKFEAQLREFLKAHAQPATDAQAGNTTALRTTTTKTNADGTTITTTSVAPLPAPGASATTPAGRAAPRRSTADNKPEASAPPFFIERVGTLIVTSDTQFSLAALHPAGVPLLADEPGFQLARARFAHETLFVYFNTKRIERNAAEQRKKYEREAARQRAEMQRKQGGTQAENNNEVVLGTGAQPIIGAQVLPPEPTNNEENASSIRTEIVDVPTTATIPAPVPPTNVAEPTPDEPPPAATPVEERKLTPEEQAQVERQRANEQFMSILPSVIFGGMSSSN